MLHTTTNFSSYNISLFTQTLYLLLDLLHVFRVRNHPSFLIQYQKIGDTTNLILFQKSLYPCFVNTYCAHVACFFSIAAFQAFKSVSHETPITTSSFGKRSANSLIPGIAAMHGPHHVDQKSTSTYFPVGIISDNSHAFPLISFNAKFTIGYPFTVNFASVQFRRNAANRSGSSGAPRSPFPTPPLLPASNYSPFVTSYSPNKPKIAEEGCVRIKSLSPFPCNFHKLYSLKSACTRSQ